MDNYSLLTFLMLAVGLALLIAEFFIPSGGMILIIALICVGISVWCATKAWWDTGQIICWWLYIAALVVLLPGVVIGTFYLLPRTEFGRNLLMQPQSLEELTPYTEEEERLSNMIGKSGKTLTLLNPGGLISVDGERIHCESEGIMIDPGERVEVLSVRGNRLVVRRAVLPPTAPSSQDDQQPLADASPLDFDVPQS